MAKIVSLLAFFTVLFFKDLQATAHQTPEYVRFAHEARKKFKFTMKPTEDPSIISAELSLST